MKKNLWQKRAESPSELWLDQNVKWELTLHTGQGMAQLLLTPETPEDVKIVRAMTLRTGREASVYVAKKDHSLIVTVKFTP